MSQRRRGYRRRSNLRLYALMTLACGALAVVAHFLFEAPAAVRSAVRSEVKAATSGQQLPAIPR